MDLVAAWLLFPLALAVVSVGCGLLVERLAGARAPVALVAPLGLGVVLVVARLAVSSSETARLGLPVALALALAGWVLAVRARSAWRLDGVALAVAVATFAVCGAPVFLSGAPTFGGYTLIGDTSFQLTLADMLARQGPNWEALPLSSTRASMEQYISTGYPVAAQAALGVLAPLGVIDLAWLYQPFIAYLGAMSACSLVVLVRRYVGGRFLPAAIAFTAATPALVVAYAQQGAIKEIAALSMLILTVVLATLAAAERWPVRSLTLVAISAAAAVGSLGLAAVPYLAVALGCLGAVVGWRLLRARRRRELAWAAGVGLLAAVLALPALLESATAYAVSTGVLSRQDDLGHLPGSLLKVQVFGIWPAGDYRHPPESHRNLWLSLLGVPVAAAVFGAIWTMRRRAVGVVLLVAVLGLVSLALLPRAGPYADAKLLVMASPAAVLLSLLGAVSLVEAGRRLEGGLLGAFLVAGVVGSNALTYHDAQLAPYERYRELSAIDERFAGRGGAIFTDWDEFGKYFLRRTPGWSQPEWLHVYRRANPAHSPAVAPALADPQLHPVFNTPIDLDELQLDYIAATPLIVMRRGPASTRPPASFRLAHSGRYYEVWERIPGAERAVKAHMPLGRRLFEPAAVPRCGDVVRFARASAGRGDVLAYAPRPKLPVLMPADATGAPWPENEGWPGALAPLGPGRVDGAVTVPKADDYRVWIEGSFGRAVNVAVDGRSRGGIANEQGSPGQYFPLASAALSGGEHRLTIARGGADLRPGNGGSRGGLRRIGPVVLSSSENERREVRRIPAERARELCGQRLDWIEVVAARAAA